MPPPQKRHSTCGQGKGYSHAKSLMAPSTSHVFVKRRNLFLQTFDEQGELQEEESTSLRHNAFEVKNDYSQHFLQTRERPQNFIRDVTIEDGFAEYPKLAKLLSAKQHIVETRKTPAMYVKADLRTFDLRSLGTKFDIIYIDPPWEEYTRRAAPFVLNGKPSVCSETCDASLQLDEVWGHEDLESLPIDEIGELPSFVFLWCGSGGRITEGSAQGALHVEDGRRLLKKWGYRRCEEICWVKTNKHCQHSQPELSTSATSLFVRTKEHCLMGIKGSVRRNRDGHIIHCNVHTDLVVGEQPIDPLSTAKPEEIYTIMEQFCLGRRRLELFGCSRNIRPGWVTVGKDVPGTTYDARTYSRLMEEPGLNPDGTMCAGHLVGSTVLIEDLRPKTPPREQREREAAMGMLRKAVRGGRMDSLCRSSPRPRSRTVPSVSPQYVQSLHFHTHQKHPEWEQYAQQQAVQGQFWHIYENGFHNGGQYQGFGIYDETSINLSSFDHSEHHREEQHVSFVSPFTYPSDRNSFLPPFPVSQPPPPLASMNTSLHEHVLSSPTYGWRSSPLSSPHGQSGRGRGRERSVFQRKPFKNTQCKN